MQCFDPKCERIIEIGEKKYLTNDKYYLRNFLDWDEDVRDWLASKENVTLEAEHICAIECIRKDFDRTKVHPVVRAVTAELKKQFGTEKSSVKYFHSLFPLGIHQAFLIAGLPMQEPCC
jgi:TusE/DsrC/DsvC family sulfur relay protein